MYVRIHVRIYLRKGAMCYRSVLLTVHNVYDQEKAVALKLATIITNKRDLLAEN